MKRTLTALTLALSMSLFSLPSDAQSRLVKLTDHLEPYGFFCTSAAFDAREVKTDSEDLFYYLPYDSEINKDGYDIWYNPSLKVSALTTRLGFNLTGFQYGALNVTGRLETDFHIVDNGAASLHLREAYLNFGWGGLGRIVNTVDVKAGHAWHPMSLDMPCTIGYEAGSPFNPYARSPQLMASVSFLKRFTFTAGALYPMEFMPTGPQGSSADYVKYGIIPELYAGLSFSAGHFTAKAGVDFLSLKPRWRTLADGYYYYKGAAVEDRLSMISPMCYAEYSKGLFKVNAKAVLASGGDHLRLLGGYALYDRTDPLNYKYTPLRSLTTFVSASYGDRWQFMFMAGGMVALGTSHDLLTDYLTGVVIPDYIYYSEAGFKNVRDVVRVVPAVAYNLDKLTFALEYNGTCAWYGDVNSLSSRGVAVNNVHNVINHRVLGVVKYSF